MPALNRNQIKYIVILAMLIDHIAWAFLPLGSPLGQVAHCIGRLTGPSMACFLASGYRYTRSIRRYGARLALFTLLSWGPYVYFEYGHAPVFMRDGEMVVQLSFGVIYTLFLSLMALRLVDKPRYPAYKKLLGLSVLFPLTVFGDWPFFDMLFALIFFLLREDKKKCWAAYTLIAAVKVLVAFIGSGAPLLQLYQLGVFLVPLLFIGFYNGESGSRRPVHKWFFYIFYPAHLVALGVLRWGL